MLIKNPFRITEKLNRHEFVPTAHGNLPAPDWCKREAERLVRFGIKAKAVSSQGACYVVRAMEGCRLTKKDKPEKTQGGR